MKIAKKDDPNHEGFWISKIVPNIWPGDDKAQSHMLRTPPDYDYQEPAFDILSIVEIKPGPSDLPGTLQGTPIVRPVISYASSVSAENGG
jgi:hypothetical protein